MKFNVGDMLICQKECNSSSSLPVFTKDKKYVIIGFRHTYYYGDHIEYLLIPEHNIERWFNVDFIEEHFCKQDSFESFDYAMGVL